MTRDIVAISPSYLKLIVRHTCHKCGEQYEMGISWPKGVSKLETSRPVEGASCPNPECETPMMLPPGNYRIKNDKLILEELQQH
jgi:hypothetical protein